MSEKLPPQRPEQEHTPNHEKERLADRIPAIISKYEKKLAEATSEVEADNYRKKIEDLKNTLERNSESPDTILTTPSRTTYNVDPRTETTEHIDDTDTAEDYDEAAEKANLTPAERKYELMQSDAAQAAFMEGGDEAYIKFIEEGFKAVDESYSQELVPVSKELQTQYVATPETDAYGNPVQHQLEWSRNGAPAEDEPFKPFGELPQNGTYISKSKELVPIEKPKFELPEGLADSIKEARERYAELTARDRKSYFVGRYTKDPRSITGKILYAIPGVRKITGAVIDKVNEKQESEIDEAILEYERLVGEVQKAFAQYGVEQNLTPDKIRIGAAIITGNEDLMFEARVVAQRHEQSKDTNPFVDWWVSQKGFVGNVKKAGVVAGGAAAIGVVSAFAAPVWIAALAGGAGGGAFGGWVANHITRRRANAKVYSRDSEGTIHRDANNKKVKIQETVAETQSAEDTKKKQAIVENYTNQVANGKRENVADNFDVSELTSITEDRSDEEAFNNRSRFRKAVMLGKLAGGMTGGLLSSALHDASASAVNQAPKTPDAPAPTPAPSTPEAPAINGEHFVVERGSGYTKELMQFAQANGHNLSPSQSFQLHEYLMSKFGPDYINIQGTGGHDIYTQAGDVRLSSPGNAEWVKGVTAEAQKWMTGRGLW